MTESSERDRVYVIQNSAGCCYVGVSDDVERRLFDQNSGVSGWIRNRGPGVLVWQGDAMSLGEARRLENTLRKQKGGAGFFKMTGLNGLGS